MIPPLHRHYSKVFNFSATKVIQLHRPDCWQPNGMRNSKLRYHYQMAITRFVTIFERARRFEMKGVVLSRGRVAILQLTVSDWTFF